MCAVTVDVQPIVYTTDQTPTPVPNHAVFIWPLWMSEMEFGRCVQTEQWNDVCTRKRGGAISLSVT